MLYCEIFRSLVLATGDYVFDLDSFLFGTSKTSLYLEPCLNLGDGAILLKKIFYFQYFTDVSCPLKIDVFGLSGLQMEHLINFILFWW